MSARRAGGGQAWLVAAAGGAVTVGAVLMLFREPRVSPVRGTEPNRPSAKTEAPPPVGLVPWTGGEADKLLAEEAILRDPTPLFLPTERNAAEVNLPVDLHREPGTQFQNYPAQLQFAEAELKLNFPLPLTPPANPADGLALDKPDRPLGGFGETDAQVAPLTTREGFVEVTATGDGRVLLAEALTNAHPPGEASWQPLEFLVTVDAMGLVRPPVLTESSRVAAVDDYFQDFLGSGLHIGERLPPGFYRIAIGP